MNTTRINVRQLVTVAGTAPAVRSGPTGGGVTSVALRLRAHRAHDYGPWRGLNTGYQCKRCSHRVPPGMAPSEQPGCIEDKG